MRIAWGSGRCLSDTSPRSSELFEYVIIESKCGEDAKGWNSDAISCCLSWEEKCFVDQAAIAAADPHQCLESRLPGVNVSLRGPQSARIIVVGDEMGACCFNALLPIWGVYIANLMASFCE